MQVLLLTVFLSTLLAVFFLMLFIRERQKRNTFSSPEQQALRPLDTEQPKSE
ncbi:MAG: hypothetical protein AAF546_14045 [Verrucomicrobiota bacterium]